MLPSFALYDQAKILRYQSIFVSLLHDLDSLPFEVISFSDIARLDQRGY
jgi:hypothetical protein